MSLSTNKLKQFLDSSGYIVSRYFLVNGKCRYVDILNTNKAISILLYIPNNYDFEMMNETNIFHLEYVHLDDKEHDEISDYVEIDENNVQKHYQPTGELSMTLPEKTQVSMSQHLNSSYQHNIILKNTNKKLHVRCHDLKRQLERFKYSIQGMQHKIALFQSPYIGVINEKNNVEIYTSEYLENKVSKHIYVVIDFKIFYDKSSIVTNDIEYITTGLFTILETNQSLHLQNINYLSQKNKDISQHSTRLSKNKHELQQYIEKYSNLLNEVVTEETKYELEMKEIEMLPQTTLTDTKLKQTLFKKIQKLKKVKENLIQHIQSLKLQYEHISLTIDSLLFDNIIMMDKIFRNFKQLEQLKIRDDF